MEAKVVSLTATVLITCVAMPLEMYWFKSFWNYKHDLIIMKRRPYMLLRQLSLLWLWTLVVQIRFIVWAFNKNEDDMPMPMKYGLDILLMSPAFVFAAMFVGRLWVLFFSYLYSLNMK